MKRWLPNVIDEEIPCFVKREKGKGETPLSLRADEPRARE